MVTTWEVCTVKHCVIFYGKLFWKYFLPFFRCIFVKVAHIFGGDQCTVIKENIIVLSIHKVQLDISSLTLIFLNFALLIPTLSIFIMKYIIGNLINSLAKYLILNFCQSLRNIISALCKCHILWLDILSCLHTIKQKIPAILIWVSFCLYKENGK